jgi:hypothetical protein
MEYHLMHKALYWSLAAMALFAGCATFKELEPEPPLNSAERGFIELKNDKENFFLEEGKCYFIRFPGPAQDNYTLLLRTSAAWYINAYMTRTFDDGKGPITPMTDEAPVTDSTSVYAIDKAGPVYYWVIDTVRQDVEMRMLYRYVPRWRFTFENKYQVFKKVLGDNRVGRGTFLNQDDAPSIQGMNHREALVELKAHTDALKAMQTELQGVASLFPADIAAANDTAYRNYTAMRSALEDELQFQESYARALAIFDKEKSSRRNTREFLADAAEYNEFLAQSSKYPASLVAKVRETLGNRLGEAFPFYEQQVVGKKEAKTIVLDPPLEQVTRLFRSCNRQVPSDFESLSAFVQRFNKEVDAATTAGERVREMQARVSKQTTPPELSFYGNMEASAADIKASLPKCESAQHPRYGNLEASQAVARELDQAAQQADDLNGLFAAGRQIAGDIGAHLWASAEKRTADLFYGRDGHSYETVAHHREKFVKWFESDIFNGVRAATRERLDAYVKSVQATYVNIPALYADSAFMPAYRLTFSTIGEGDLAKKRAVIDEYIAHVRQVEFPEGAIKTLYAEFNHDLGATGVERARAIVEHGKMYRGTDKQVTAMVNECDPTVAKWIIKPKEYRRILAFPVTSNKGGTNEYVFRIKLQIPSDAQFPVFDVNVKLPREVATTGAGEAWYEKITINNNIIKNEGRFRITAPLPDNNYESQITPVQMDKAGNNILEVRFKKPAFKVFEISAMAQVPIMKKN